MTIQLGDVIQNTIWSYKPNIQSDNDLFFLLCERHYNFYYHSGSRQYYTHCYPKSILLLYILIRKYINRILRAYNTMSFWLEILFMYIISGYWFFDKFVKEKCWIKMEMFSDIWHICVLINGLKYQFYFWITIFNGIWGISK